MSRRNAHRPVVVTTAPESPAAQRKHRERQYMIMMAIRMACFLLIFVVPGIWKIVMIGLAVVLPGIAVILANAVDRRRQNSATMAEPGDAPELPSGVVLEADEDLSGGPADDLGAPSDRPGDTRPDPTVSAGSPDSAGDGAGAR